MINGNQGNDAVTVCTKLIDQRRLGYPAKRSSNDIVDRSRIIKLFLANDHERIVCLCAPWRQAWLQEVIPIGLRSTRRTSVDTQTDMV